MITTPLSPADTSAAARRSHEGSGRAATHRKQCLDKVLEHPGLTAAEIASAIGLERHEPSRRLPELRAKGLVKNGPARICRVQQSMSLTWVAADSKAEVQS